MTKLDAIVNDYMGKVRELLAAPAHTCTKALRGTLPAIGGLYHIVQEGEADLHSLYVGETNHLQRRVYDTHILKGKGESPLRKTLLKRNICCDEVAVTTFLREGCRVQFIIVADAQERKWLEHFAIAVLQPSCNG